MYKYQKKSALTLTEMLVVIAVIALLFGIGVPAAKKMVKSFESAQGVRTVIEAALSNARAIAVKHGTYAGLRFQQSPQGTQYMVLIIHDPLDTGLANGFKAIPSRNPITLPDSFALLTTQTRTNLTDPSDSDSIEIIADADVDQPYEINDITTFSVIFNPSGRLVIHDIRIRRASVNDTVFNELSKVTAQNAILFQDDYPDLGLGQESSVKSFAVYEKNQLGQITYKNGSISITDNQIPANVRYTEYISSLTMLYINPATGEIINKIR